MCYGWSVLYHRWDVLCAAVRVYCVAIAVRVANVVTQTVTPALSLTFSVCCFCCAKLLTWCVPAYHSWCMLAAECSELQLWESEISTKRN